MMEAIRNDTIPHLLVMHYAPCWTVEKLLLIPSFFLNSSAIEKRKPLSQNARRAGWVGCNIRLSAIAAKGHVKLVEHGVARDCQAVRDHFLTLKPLARLAVSTRGWTLDVLRVIESLRKPSFALEDVYEFAKDLSTLHPANRNIRPKIRQQLQVLRDMGFLQFVGRGQYRLRVRV